MRFRKITAAAIAALTATTQLWGISVFADDSVISVKPDFPEFNELITNGSVIINLPENTSASVDIKFTSPESDYDYYHAVLDSAEGSSFSCDIEGNEDRVYMLELSVKDTADDLSSKEAFKEEFTVDEAEDNPDSHVDYVYNISLEKKNDELPYVFEKVEKNVSGGKRIETNITFYVAEVYLKDDVNNDGVVDSDDASQVLAHYASTATGQGGIFNESQLRAGNVNGDSVIDSDDASKILAYYAAVATGKVPSWD